MPLVELEQTRRTPFRNRPVRVESARRRRNHLHARILAGERVTVVVTGRHREVGVRIAQNIELARVEVRAAHALAQISAALGLRVVQHKV